MKAVPKITSTRNEGLEMLGNSYINDLDRIMVSVSRRQRAAGLQEEGRHAVSNFGRAVRMKIAVRWKKMQHRGGV